MSYLKTIRDHAHQLPLDDKRRAPLVALADEIQSQVKVISSSYHLPDITHLNSLIALSNRLIIDIKRNPPGAGGQMPVEQERLAA